MTATGRIPGSVSGRFRLSARSSSAAPARLLSAGLQFTSMALGLRGESDLPNATFRVGAHDRDGPGRGSEDPIDPRSLRARSRRELFFIDAAVVDPGAFWLAAPSGASVVRIPAEVDSWQFMAREAEQFRNLAAIHIVSHGQPGALILNGRRYAADDLEARSLLLRELGRALAKNGDILLYGCDTGEGVEGARLVDDVAQITGADVAASSHPIGGLPGADWKLEIVHGKVRTAAVAPAGYEHVLANFSVNSISTLRAAIATAVSDSTNDTITLTGNITAVSGDPVTAPDGNPTFVVIDNTGGHTITLNGGGFTLSAGNFGRVLYVEAGAVDVSNLTITNGLLAQNGANGGSSAPQLSVGAGIFSTGTLQLNNVTVTANRATGGGGGGGFSGVYVGGGGGGSGGVGGIGGATGGSAGPGTGSYAGVGGSGSSGGRGGSYDGTHLDGRGGTSSGGGAGGTTSFPFGGGGSGGTATGGVTVGGGGGGSGYNTTGGAGGPAAGGIFNSGTLFIFGSSEISNNLGAAGGGGGGGGSGNHGGLGGLGVGGVWNTGTLHIASAVNTGMSGNAGASGALGGLSILGGNSGPSSPTAVANIYNTGTLDTNYVAGPVLTASIGSAAFTAADNGVSTPVTVDGGLSVSDAAETTLASATVAITGNFQSGEDVLSFTNNGSTMGNITGSYFAGAGILTLSSAGATATLAQWQSALESVAYTDTAVTPNAATRTVSFTVNDGVQNSATVTKTVTVADVDQTPIVTTSGGTTGFVSSGGAVAVDSSVVVSDLDKATLASAVATITGNFHSAEDVLGFANNGTTMGNIIGSYASGVLTLTSSGATATLAQWQSALRVVTYNDTAVTPATATRTVSFTVNDGTESSAVATKAISLTVIPAVIGVTGPTNGTYAAGQNLDISITFNENVTVATGSGTPAIAIMVGSSNRNAVYVSGGGTATLVFQYTVQVGDEAAGGISVSSPIALNGGTIAGAGSIGAILSFTAPSTSLVLVSTAPILTADSGSAAFTAADNGVSTSVPVDGGLTISDSSQTTLASATVAITSNFQSGEDVLSLTNDGSTMGNIAGVYDATSGILTLISSGATASLPQWQSALESVTYSDTAVTPNSATRTVSFSVNDGVQNSATVTRTVTVADVDQTPILTTGSGTAAFTSGAGAVAVDGAVVVSDLDNANLASATVAITGNFQSAEDVLAFSNDGSTMGNITGSYNATTGVLTLTSSGSTATLAQWQNALRAVTYNDTAGSPNTAARTVSFTVSDGTLSSATATRQISVVQVVTPTLAWANPAAIAYGTALTSAQLDATASANGNAVAGAFSYNPSIGTILAPGYQTISVTFTPSDSIHYTMATGSVTISIGQAAPGIAWATPASIVYGTALSAAQLNASATSNGGAVAGSFAYNPGSGAVLNAGSQTLGVTFTPSNTSDYAAETGSVNLNVTQASQSIAFPTVVGAKVGIPVTLSGVASSGLQPVTFALVSGNATLSGSVLTFNDTNPVVVGASQAGNANFLPSTASQTIVASARQSQTIAFAPISQHKTNDQPFLLSATANSGLPVSFTLEGGPATMSGNTVILTGATGMVTVQASQAGNTTYQAAPPVAQSFAVVEASFQTFFGATAGSIASSSTNGSRSPQAEAAASRLSAGIGITLKATAIGNNLAATLSADGASGVLIGYLASSNQGFVLNFTPDANGDFSAAATTFGGSGPPVVLTISGTATQSGISGSIQPLGLTFGLTPDPLTGTSANVSGYYESSNLDDASGSTYMVVGTQGEVFVLAISSPTTVAAGAGTVNADNDSFAVEASSSVAVSGTLDAVSDTVTGTVTGQSGTVNFSGTSDAVNAIHPLINMSGRGWVAPSQPLIVGFVVGGSVAKTVVLRGIGPGLAAFGVAHSLAQPLLVLYNASGQVLGSNAGWGGAAALASAFNRLGAFALSPTSADSALEATLQPGAYSIVISDGADDGGGTALAEIYDASIDPSGTTQLLLNVSTRGQVTTANPVIGGFIVGGNSPKLVLIRAAGPGLASFGVAGALPDPVLTLYNVSGSIVARNSGWNNPQAITAGQVVASATDLAAASNSVGAFPLAPASFDSALIVTLAPGNYSAVVTSADGNVGTALVEVYQLSQ